MYRKIRAMYRARNSKPAAFIHPLPERSLLPASQRYRARAEECRQRAVSIHDPRTRTQMLRLAADYESKAMQAEAFEIKESKND